MLVEQTVMAAVFKQNESGNKLFQSFIVIFATFNHIWATRKWQLTENRSVDIKNNWWISENNGNLLFNGGLAPM